jgi:hypothetical protein
MNCTQELATRQLLVRRQSGMGVVVVSLLVSNRCLGLLEEHLVWSQRLFGGLDVLDVSNQPCLRGTSFVYCQIAPCWTIVLKLPATASYTLVTRLGDLFLTAFSSPTAEPGVERADVPLRSLRDML